MKRENIAILLGLLAPIWWVSWNFYFGWNKEPQTPLEGFTDMMFWVILFLSYIIKPSINKTEYIFNGTNKVEIARKN